MDEEFVDLDVDPDAVVNVDPDVNVDVDPEPPIVNTIPTQKVASVGALAPLFAVLQSAGSGYSAALMARPILTKSLTAGLTFFLSDYTAQHIEKPKEGADADATSGATTGKRARKGKKAASAPAPAPAWKRDWMRTIVSCAVGLFYFGPAAHYWYEWIFSILPSTSLVSTLQKAILGQLIFGPSFTCIFFATSLMQAGQFNVKNWVLKIKRDLPGAWLSGVGFWPIVDLISFSLIPVKFIPLFINLCSFVWTIYLSSVANRSTQVE